MSCWQLLLQLCAVAVFILTRCDTNRSFLKGSCALLKYLVLFRDTVLNPIGVFLIMSELKEKLVYLTLHCQVYCDSELALGWCHQYVESKYPHLPPSTWPATTELSLVIRHSLSNLLQSPSCGRTASISTSSKRKVTSNDADVVLELEPALTVSKRWNGICVCVFSAFKLASQCIGPSMSRVYEMWDRERSRDSDSSWGETTSGFQTFVHTMNKDVWLPKCSLVIY